MLTCTHTDACTCTHKTHSHTCRHMVAHTLTHALTHAAHTCAHTHVHSQHAHTYTHTAHTHVHIHSMHAHTCAHTVRTHTYTRTRSTHTHVRSHGPSSFSSLLSLSSGIGPDRTWVCPSLCTFPCTPGTEVPQGQESCLSAAIVASSPTPGSGTQEVPAFLMLASPLTKRVDLHPPSTAGPPGETTSSISEKPVHMGPRHRLAHPISVCLPIRLLG